jgi:hypothetical protein
MGGWPPDRPKPAQQKPPEKAQAPPAVENLPPRDVAHPADKQQDGKGNKDNQGPAGQQGGKPADVTPKQQGDAGARQTGDTTGKPANDAGSRHGGDGPVKIDERPGDAPHQTGDQHPGWHLTTNFTAWNAQSQALWQPRPDSRTPSGSTDAKGAQQGGQRYEKFTHRLNLDDCRADNGKFDREKLKAKLDDFVGKDQLARTTARLDAARDPQHHGPVSTRPMEMTVRVENARSYVDVREVEKAMHDVSDKYRVHCRVEIPGRPPIDIRPGPVVPSDKKAGAGHGADPPRPVRPDEGFRPQPVPQFKPVHNNPRGK